jgi:hypothetical protein
MNKKIETVVKFNHQHGGHCETGSVSSLVTNFGFKLSEPMAFGISSGIGFTYFPFIKIWSRPLISFRMMPRSIVKGVQKRLGVRFAMKSYNDQDLAMTELDDLLAKGTAVGMQTSVSFLTYFLPDFRIPFNAHMTIVIGKEGDEYLMSDPLFDRIMRIRAEDLKKARFAKGINAPHGFIFYPTHVPEKVDYLPPIKKAIKKTVNMMLQPMFPFVGIKGILAYAKSVEKLRNHPDRTYPGKYLSQIVMFQEEVGTGGGGFRFMYAAFLREAYDILKIPGLLEASKKMVETGDLLRRAAGACAKVMKARNGNYDLMDVVRQYRECAMSEKEVYLMLKKIKWK